MLVKEATGVIIIISVKFELVIELWLIHSNHELNNLKTYTKMSFYQINAFWINSQQKWIMFSQLNIEEQWSHTIIK